MSWHPEDERRYNDGTRKLKDHKKNQRRNISGIPSKLNNDNWHRLFTLGSNQKLKQPTQRIPPIRKADETWALSDKERANTFAGQLEKALKPHEAFETKINKALEEPVQIAQQQKFFYT
jgi:hypothetical protein